MLRSTVKCYLCVIIQYIRMYIVIPDEQFSPDFPDKIEEYAGMMVFEYCQRNDEEYECDHSNVNR